MREGQTGGSTTERDVHERLLSVVSLELMGYHRSIGTDSRREWATAQGDLQQATTTLIALMNAGAPVIVRFGSHNTKLHSTSKNAYDFVTLSDWKPAEPGQVLKLHEHSVFRSFDGDETYVGDYVDLVKVKDLAEALCEDARLTLAEAE